MPGDCLIRVAMPWRSPVVEWQDAHVDSMKLFPPSAALPTTIETALAGLVVAGDAETVHECGDVAICSGVSANAGMPLSGRPARMTGPISSPFCRRARLEERSRLGPPSPPRMSAPWQNVQLVLNVRSSALDRGFVFAVRWDRRRCRSADPAAARWSRGLRLLRERRQWQQ